MTNSVLQHIAESIRTLTPYQPGRPIDEVAKERGLTDVIKLASNENPLGASKLAMQALRDLSATTVSRYPDGNCGQLRAATAARLGVAPERLIFGNGSNEILELAAQAVLTENSIAVYSQYAFAVYALATAARRAQGVVVPAVDYAHDLATLAQRANEDNVRLLFIANPNNPTGTWHPPQKIAAMMKQIPSDVLVVLDEAYREYVDEQDDLLTSEFDNLLITRTFSKIHGLAGLRIGYGVGDVALIDMLNRIRQPFNLGGAAQVAAVAALKDETHVERSVQLNAAGMAQIIARLQELELQFIPSRANFITFKVEDTARIYEELLNAGVIVRALGGYEMPNWLRVTIGLEEENVRFLNALQQAMN